MAKYASRELYGEIVEGPGGAVMPEALARLIEKEMPALPEECRTAGFRRSASLPEGMEIKEGERSDISLITSDAVDRDREVMLPGGGDWKDFRKNPVVTFAHRYDELPVGRALWIKRSKEEGRNGWLAKTQYTERPATWEGAWFPDAVWHMVKSGDLRGKSIGFLPTDISAPTEKEIEARPEMAGVTTIIRKWMALEYAVAPVQSNPDAYVIAVGKARESGLEIPECILDEAGICLPTTVPKLSYEQATASSAESEKIADMKGVIPYKDTGKATESAAWDGPKEIAGAEVADLKIICTWVDGEHMDVKSGYKLPHHQASGHKAVWRGVAAAMAALMGGRGGVALPAGDRRGVYNHLAKHYKEFDKEAPDFKALAMIEAKKGLAQIDIRDIVAEEIGRLRGRV